MGLERKNMIWTQEEIDFLYDSWGKLTVSSIAKRLKRTEKGVIGKKDQLKLGGFFESSDYITVSALKKQLGYNNPIMFVSESWIKEKQFPVRTKRGKEKSFKIVNLKEFWRWAKKNKDLLNFAKFEKYSLGPEPKRVEEKRRNDQKNKSPYDKRTEQEEKELVSLINQYSYTYNDIAKILGRKESAIISKVKALGIKMKPIPMDRTLYSEKEINTIIENIKLGHDYEYIQSQLEKERTITSISNKVYKMFGTQSLYKVRKILNEKAS